MGREASASLDEDLDPLADGLPADGADGEGCAAVRAGAVAALEHQFDLVVDADRAGDALFHLPVAVLQLLHELPLVGGFRAGAALHLGAVLFQFFGYCHLTFDALLHPPGAFFTHNTVLAGEEMDEQGQLRADQALCGHRHARDTKVGHGVGGGVHPAKAAGDG